MIFLFRLLVATLTSSAGLCESSALAQNIYDFSTVTGMSTSPTVTVGIATFTTPWDSFGSNVEVLQSGMYGASNTPSGEFTFGPTGAFSSLLASDYMVSGNAYGSYLGPAGPSSLPQPAELQISFAKPQSEVSFDFVVSGSNMNSSDILSVGYQLQQHAVYMPIASDIMISTSSVNPYGAATLIDPAGFTSVTLDAINVQPYTDNVIGLSLSLANFTSTDAKLVSTPEPSSWALSLVAFGSMLYLRRIVHRT